MDNTITNTITNANTLTLPEPTKGIPGTGDSIRGPAPLGLPDPVQVAGDTEFCGTHTLTAPAAARLDADTLVIQPYKSAAVPGIPDDFDLHQYLPLTQEAYGRFCKKIVVRPVLPLTADLSPLTMVRDLYALHGVSVLPRSKGWDPPEGSGLAPGPFIWTPANTSLDERSRRCVVPAIQVTMVTHFSRADFLRIHGRAFLESLKAGAGKVESRVAMRERKFLQFVEEHGRWTDTDPILGYYAAGEDRYEVRVTMRDTRMPYGKSGLDGLSQTFLKVPKSKALGKEDKENMLQAFQARTADAYGYAMVDAVNTLLIYEQMQIRDREIYQAFGFSECEIPPLRPTLGGRVSSFLVNSTRRDVASGSAGLPSDRALQEQMAKGGVALFAQRPGVSRFGDQTGKVHGGLLYSRSPTKFWHEADRMLRDIDLVGCYNNITARLNIYWGRPVIYEPGERRLPLAQAVAFVREHADPDAWFIRVSGNIEAYPNALIPSTQDAITSLNYRQRLKKGKRRRARQRAFHLEALRDPASVKGVGGSRLYSDRVESGVVTWATWLMIRALPPGLREQYEKLTADTIVFYPRKLAAGSGPEYDALVEQYRTEELPWESAIDLEAMEQVQLERIDADYVSLKFPIKEIAQKVGELRKEAQKKEGKGSGADHAWKQHGNTMYGVLACSHMPTNNFVGGNQITAQGRAEAFAMCQALNGIQLITDGTTYRRDQIPSCTYEECLKKKPDYPIRRAEHGDGVPFLDPATIPQDDAGFTAWYRDHVKWFFGVSGPDYDNLFATHDLEHKKTGKSKSVAFDGLGCDGSGNYLKCTRTPEGGWQVEDGATRAYGPISKQVLGPWLVGAYSKDCLTEPPPVTEDIELLSLFQAGHKARKALEARVPAVYFPLGLEYTKVMNYRLVKASAFVFRTPEQRMAILKQLQKFEKKTRAGLEVLALRRSYGGRRRGSLADVAEELYELIRRGEDNLTKALNLAKLPNAVLAVTRPHLQEIVRRKDEARAKLLQTIDARNLPPEALPTAYIVTAADLVHFKGGEALVLQTAPAPAPAQTEGQCAPCPAAEAGGGI